jgi:uncharacterized protein YegP (UPF0339 family)
MPAPSAGRHPPGAPSAGGAFFDDSQEDWQMFEWELCRSTAGWWFRLKSASNGQTIVVSEVYRSKQAAQDTLESLRCWFGMPAVRWHEVEVDLDP